MVIGRLRDAPEVEVEMNCEIMELKGFFFFLQIFGKLYYSYSRTFPGRGQRKYNLSKTSLTVTLAPIPQISTKELIKITLAIK